MRCPVFRTRLAGGLTKTRPWDHVCQLHTSDTADMHGSQRSGSDDQENGPGDIQEHGTLQHRDPINCSSVNKRSIEGFLVLHALEALEQKSRQGSVLPRTW